MSEKWPIMKLEEVCEILDRLRKPITKRDRITGEYPYYGATGIVDYVNDYIFDEKLILIGEDGAKWGPGDNTAFAAEGKYWVNNHAHVIRPNRSIVLDNWLIYYLNMTDLTENITGVTVPKLNQGKLRAIQIPIPSLEEQQRIVSILDEAFSNIENTLYRAGNSQEFSKDFFQSSLVRIFYDHKENSTEYELGEICTLWQGLAINKKTKHLLVENSSLPLLRIKDLRHGTVEQYVSESGYPPNSAVDFDDVIYTRTGQVGLVFRGRKGILHNNCFKVVPNTNILLREYLFWWLQNPVFKKEIIALSSRAAQPDITHKIFKLQEIIVPSLAYQRKAVLEIEERYSESMKMDDVVKEKILNLHELKQSILQEAFNGNLTKRITA